MILMIRKGTRGGISTISNRYGKANNKYMKNFNSKKKSTYLTYLDANNLYGWARSKPLPIGNFDWMSEDEIINWNKLGDGNGCILEVDLEYPKELHDLHNDYPLAAESMKPHKVAKLIPNLNNKVKYVLHYENLKQYLSLGLKLKCIHRGIKFTESAWLKRYIDINTNLRSKAKNDFEKDFFKLMNNSVFGKTMENIEKHEKKLLKLAAKPNYERCTIFDDNLCAVHMKKNELYYNKPIYLGMSILDLSKTCMYDFHYNYIKNKYGEQANLLFTDTDSLAYEIKTEDFYQDIKSDIDDKFDMSDYPKNHPLHSDKNKKVIGMFKDECAGKIMDEFVGLRSKLYSYMVDGKESKKCKGVKKNVVKNQITHGDYLECLNSGVELLKQMNTIRSYKHDLYSETINKVALSANDDKRFILKDGKSTLAYGHYKIMNKLIKMLANC